MKLSIIIPIYNTEAYLEKCLTSLFDQLLDCVEIILINDGSTDTSLQIIQNLCDRLPKEKCHQVICMSQQNQGVSQARNQGLSIATGKYIAFIDADDFVSPQYLKKILIALESQSDLIQINAQYFYGENSEQNRYLNTATEKYKGTFPLTFDLQKEIFNSNQWFSFVRIYKKELISDVFFPVGMTHFEDAYVWTDIVLKSKTIFFIPESLYYYRVHNLSASNSSNPNTQDKLIVSSEKLIEKLISSYPSNILYGIPLMHFFNIYIVASKKYKSETIAKENWIKFSKKIDALRIPSNLITPPKERYLLYFLNYGIWSHYLVKKLCKLLKKGY